MKWVTIYRFTYQHQALTICSKLEAEGIECVLQDQLTTQVMPLYSNALGGIKLQVGESDAARAIEMLKEAGISDEPDASTLVEKLLQETIGKIPTGQKWRFYAIIALVTLLTALLITGLIYYLALPA
jgi:hypothetical protein